MSLLKSILLAGGASLVFAAAAQGADLPTKKAPPVPPPTLAMCASVSDFFLTACPLTYNGITLYGTIDAGVGFETFGAPFNAKMQTGVDEFIGKPGRHNIWALTPNGLSQSNIGVKFKEDVLPGGWSIVGLAETGFDPYSLQLGNGQGAMVQNNRTLLSGQSANADSSRAGQWDNSQAFIGVSNSSYGTLTFGRQNTLLLDGVNAYDPMGGSYAFSPIGWSGATVGTGDTEDARANTAVKYRVSIGQFRIGAIAQIGDYAQGNGASSLYQGQIGGDFGGLSVDGIVSRVNDAVNLGTYPSATSLGAPPTTDTLKAVISDNTSFMLLAKYTWNQFKFFGGYEYIQYANPSGQFAVAGNDITTIGGYQAINQGNQFFSDKVLQVFWTGAKYAVTTDLDLTVAYYHYDQNNFNGAGVGKAYSCSSTAHGYCSGTMDAASAMADWRFAKKFDAYAGVMYSEVNNGLASGYQGGGHVNVAPTAGLRMRF